MGTLYLVATPIGNLEDMSPRAVRTLREARLIAAEDTRHTRQLLTHFDIHTPMTSYFEHNKLAKLDDDSFSPFGRRCRPRIGRRHTRDQRPRLRTYQSGTESWLPCQPGAGPLGADRSPGCFRSTDGSFLYLGYLPRKSSERKEFLSGVADQPYTLIFLEAPHRLLESLEDLLAVLGDRPITAARELTKLHEQFVRGRISEVREHFTQHEPRGEFVLVVDGMRELSTERWTDEQMRVAIARELNDGGKAKEISTRLSIQSGWNKKEIYSYMNRSSENKK